MRTLLPILILIAAGCDRAGSAPSQETRPAASACNPVHFEGDRFTVCSGRGARIEIRTADGAGKPYRSFGALGSALGKRSDRIKFAMNAGMYDEDGHAIGLLIERGKQLHKVNRRDGGGNFHLKPNGIFLVHSDGTANVITTEEFDGADGIAYATQSGPMLVIDGKVNPAFEPDGESRHFRNGVGIGPDGTPIFAISEEPVSFGKFARLFRDSLKARDALYFDGSVSSLWDPANGRQDAHSSLGPIIVAFKPVASKPGREGRARH